MTITLAEEARLYSFDSRVRYSEVDANGNLEIVSLINYLQDCSTFQSEHKGLGLTFMRERRFAWVLAATHIEMGRLPRFCERITVSTWCNAMKRFTANRYFTIADEAGELVVRASSLWTTVSTETPKMLPIPESEKAYLEDTPAPPLSGRLERKVVGQGEAQEGAPIVVAAHNLDTNNHVNNAQYVLLAQDALEALGLGVAPEQVACVESQYKRQAHLGDVMVPHVFDEGGARTVSLDDEAGETFAATRFTLRR